MANLVSKYKQKSVFGIEVRQDLSCSCWSVLQDVLTDLSAECENLPIEGVPGACYAHKVHSNTQYITLTPAWITNFKFSLPLQGISQAAGFIYKKLVNDGILNQAFSIVPVRV